MTEPNVEAVEQETEAAAEGVDEVEESGSAEAAEEASAED